MYELHPTLKADTIAIGDLNLCELRLMNNALVPWLILVPKRPNISEAYQLSEDEQIQLCQETSLISELTMQIFQGDKLNTGAIGNIVPQLHIHIVIRYQVDPVWPKPVWGNIEEHPYTHEEIKLVRQTLHTSIQQKLARFRPH
ncbi:HIT domain-containing protein [Arenicella xantha]|uniref:Diadenosine tetraphosphate (Ap4A) HIT family hydrolase n=1 Tax=Arenicella xantha TaxID=644221 RepID=A0A395JNQ0_9GAMM|nr:HIT family protein [Arenicella xantha]RBP53274.1 diadenosine tetraphosphate (Ap4A) HIT family hydrolase [Arenicella xantha]